MTILNIQLYSGKFKYFYTFKSHYKQAFNIYVMFCCSAGLVKNWWSKVKLVMLSHVGDLMIGSNDPSEIPAVHWSVDCIFDIQSLSADLAGAAPF